MPTHQHPRQASAYLAYLRPTSVVAMLLYSTLLLAGVVYFLASMPSVLRERADTTAPTIDVPAELTKEDTLGYR
jgi:hypothetical protein